ncbi:MAG: HAD-IA family hydrolase [Deltaproteobacteria bacterium]|nr:HAD-IA family hydrolase [Deltaproteobacteria bacterium]
MTPRFDLIIFDLDGTLIDSRQDVVTAVKRTLRDLHLPAVPEKLIDQNVGPGVKPLVQAILGPKHQDLFDRACELVLHHYSAHMLDHTRLYDGIDHVLRSLAKRKLAVVTNKPQAHADMILEGLGIRHLFGAVLGPEACARQKPDPDPIFKAMELLPALPAKTIMVGDTDIDITAGKRAGVKTCGVLYGFGTADSITAAQPDYLVTLPQELEEVL